jgi:hypothetical protein
MRHDTPVANDRKVAAELRYVAQQLVVIAARRALWAVIDVTLHSKKHTVN